MVKLEALLAATLEDLLFKYGDTPEIRLAIFNYVMGYLGIQYGYHA
jgi:hypothetical protein